MALKKKSETQATNTTNTTNANATENVVINVEVTRAKGLEYAYAFDMIANGIKIYGCLLRESKDGKNFVAFPSYKGKDGKYYSHVYFPVDDDMLANIEKQIEEKLAK